MYIIVSEVNRQHKRKQIYFIGLENIIHYTIRFIISDFFM